MELHFNADKDQRKAMVRAIETETGEKAKYLGVPSCAYQIANYIVGKQGELTIEDTNGIDNAATVIDACVMATGISPTEWESNQPEVENEEPITTEEKISLIVKLPLEKVNTEKLDCLLQAKGALIKKALGISNLNYKVEEDIISFPWFGAIEQGEAESYTKFISALCEMSVKQKRITSKAKENENEKYAFRCFLLRLGFIGNEYKAARKILLSKLDGSSAFKNPTKGGEES